MARATAVVASLATKGATTTETTVTTFGAVARNVTTLATLKHVLEKLHPYSQCKNAYAVAGRTTGIVITSFGAITGL